MAQSTWNPGEDPLGDLIRFGTPDQIARELHPHVRRVVGRALPHPLDRDLLASATNDALLAVCRYRAGFRREAKASTWVYVIARRSALKCAVKERARTRDLRLVDPAELARIADGRGRLEEHRCGEEAVEDLLALVPNAAWRRIWLLAHDPSGRASHEEVARRTGYTAASVGVILSRVRSRLNRARRGATVHGDPARRL
jgi:DNA-directed RNA polymerase specialized sigma24 family protein